MNYVQKNLKYNLPRKRKEKGLSQSALAHELGIKAPTLSAYEQGTVTPSLEIAVAIACILECSLDDLVGVKQPHCADKEMLFSKIEGKLDILQKSQEMIDNEIKACESFKKYYSLADSVPDDEYDEFCNQIRIYLEEKNNK